MNSVGLVPRHLPFTTSNTVVKTFRHALSLDERRAKFKANHWNRPTDEEMNLSLSDRQKRALAKKEREEAKAGHKHSKERSSKESPKDIERMESKHSKRLFETDVEEVSILPSVFSLFPRLTLSDEGMVLRVPLW